MAAECITYLQQLRFIIIRRSVQFLDENYYSCRPESLHKKNYAWKGDTYNGQNKWICI